MNKDGRTTSEQLYIPTLLVIGAGEALLLRCLHACKTTGLAMKMCDLTSAAGEIARRRPIAVIIPTSEFDHAGAELGTLVRDCRGALFTVDSHVSVREIEAMLAAAIGGGYQHPERREAAGRYSIVNDAIEEAPFSRRSAPPQSVRSSVPPSSKPGPVKARSGEMPAARSATANAIEKRPNSGEFAAIRAVFCSGQSASRAPRG